MVDTRHERRQHFRGKARPGRILPLRFRPTTDAPWIVAETRNIGVGGAFILTTAIPVIGASIHIELELPTSDQTFSLPAAVRWAQADGMGVQLIAVDVDVLLELNDYFSTLVGTEP